MLRLHSIQYREMMIHSVAWLAYLLIQVLALDKFEHHYLTNLFAALAQLPAQLGFTYVMLFGLIPTYLSTRRYGVFSLLTLCALLLCGILYWEGSLYLYINRLEPQRQGQESAWDVSRWIECAFYLLCTSSILIGFHMIRFGFRQQQLNQQLIIANQHNELKSLKDQINPHFLLNTLNNLYGLTSEHPQKAGEVVMRLAQLMQYMLYEGNLTQVPLRKEIDYLQNYLALERIRYDERIHLSFQIHGDGNQLYIAPLMLLPFVENAFKHGISQQLDEAWLQIQLTINPAELSFKVENSKTNERTTSNASGIGLTNIAKRLALLYPGRHHLQQLDGDGTYLVVLTLTLISTDFVSPKNHEDPLFAR